MPLSIKIVHLGLDNFLSWRRFTRPIDLVVGSGDPVALTVSPNGHDAESTKMMVGTAARSIRVGEWLTGETLGRHSTVKLIGDIGQEELAPGDWRPTPRPRKNRN